MYRRIDRERIKFIWRKGMPNEMHYHEAGHVVIAFQFGYLATKGVVVQINSDGTGSSVRSRWHNNLIKRRAAIARIILAGEIASIEACKKGLTKGVIGMSHEDMARLDEVGLKVPGVKGSDSCVPGDWGHPCVENWSVYKKTITLVRKRWPEITSVATRLAKQGELVFEEVCECILAASTSYDADLRMRNFLTELSSRPE